MQAAVDFTPIAPDEEEGLAFDFSSYLSPGDTAASLVGWTCTVADHSLVPDPTPESRLIGSASLDPSTALVVQKVGTLVSGATYVMEAVILTAGGEQLAIWQFLDCVPSGQGTVS